MFKSFEKSAQFHSRFFVRSLLGACPRLERIEVHIGISDYFMNVEDDDSKRKYKRTVKKITVFKTLNSYNIIFLNIIKEKML